MLPTFGDMAVVLTIYGLMSVVTFCLYWMDKQRARAGAWRISEAMLHVCELAGGWPGALVAQRVLRHKTRKQPYVFVLWAIVVMHVAAWIWWVAMGPGADSMGG